MIGYITGKPLFEINDNLIVDVLGVGYQINITEQTRGWALLQSEISLWIHTLVRENNFDLYGFETKNELYFFKKLLDVSGIGPRSALGIISLASTDTLYQAIVNNNIAFLTSVSGIGKKTAERMCIELRDKLKDYSGETEFHSHVGDTDVVDALVALGYSPSQAHKALSEVDPELSEINDRIKAALGKIK
jgi:Holliday junction DNA helicase RuvA